MLVAVLEAVGEERISGCVQELFQLAHDPLQNRLTLQIINHWQPFKDIKQAFAVSRRAEQLRLRSHQRINATSEDFVLRTEMDNLESQEEDPSNVCYGSSR